MTALIIGWDLECLKSVDMKFNLQYLSPKLRYIATENNYVVVSNIFYFHPYLEKIAILTNIFQMGWNHQLEKQCEMNQSFRRVQSLGFLDVFKMQFW